MTPVKALQAALAGEHAALYVYAVLGGRVSQSAAPSTAAALRSAYDAHRARRDQLQTMIRELGEQPVAPELGYDVGAPAESTDQIIEVARGLEARAAEVYGQAVASTTGTARRWAIDALGDAAVRVVSFGGEPEAFPGLAEL